jgi:DNA-directed RNA polymerase subunit omega
MIHPNIENLLNRDSIEGSKFALVTLASYRARQINSYFNQLGEGLGHMVPPQVSSVARKPLSIAFEEIAAEKIIKIERLPFDDMEQEAAEAFGEFGDDASDVAESDAE